MSRNFSLDSVSQTIFGASRNNNLHFENRIIISANTTFTIPPNAKVVKFSAVGGGRAGVGTTSGPGGGYFEKTFYAPFTGLTTSFQLTVGAVGGNTVLANSVGTTIATAFGATAIGAGATVGVGGTASGGDLNANGSPGGVSPGVGGASGGCFGDGQYNSTYAGRWVYLAESFTNDNVKNFLLTNYFANGGSAVVGINPTPVSYFGTVYSTPNSNGSPGGLFANGADGVASPAAPSNGGHGGYGGDGGNAAGSAAKGGNGGVGGRGGNGGTGPLATAGTGGFGAPGGNGSGAAGVGGTGGFGGAGGTGGLAPGFTDVGGSGGVGGFGGGGGRGGSFTGGPGPGSGGNGGAGGFGGGGGGAGPGDPIGTAGNGGAGAFIVEWTTTLPNKTGV